MKQDLDAAAPLLENDQPDAYQSKFKRKNRQDAFGTGITNFNTNLNLDKFYQKDEKLEKIEKEKNLFLQKVYLHIL